MPNEIDIDAVIAARPAFIAEAMEMCDPEDYECEDWEEFQAIVETLSLPQIPCGACEECKAEICCREIDSVELAIWNDLVLWVELSGE